MVSDLIDLAFDTPAPPVFPPLLLLLLTPPPPPPIVAPVALVSEPIVAPLAFDTPAPPVAPLPPFPPLIAPLLNSFVIVANWAFATPAPTIAFPQLVIAPRPRIMPLFVSIPIVPALETPVPPGRLPEYRGCGATADCAGVEKRPRRP